MQKSIIIVEDEFIVANDLSAILKNAGYQIIGLADSYKEALALIEQKAPDMVLLDILLKGKLTGIDLAVKLRERRIPFIYISANSNKSVLDQAKATRPYGFLVKPFREKDVLIALEIAFYHHRHSMDYQEQLKLILSRNLEKIQNHTNKSSEGWIKFSRALQTSIPFDFLLIQTCNQNSEKGDFKGFLRVGFNEYQSIGLQELGNISKLKAEELECYSEFTDADLIPLIYSREDIRDLYLSESLKKVSMEIFHMKSLMNIPLRIQEQNISVTFFSRHEETYQNEHLDLFIRSQGIIANTLSKLLLSPSKQESPSVEPPVTPQISGFGKIIGKSPLLLNVFDHIKKVAPMDTSVLILGDSGTGKELVARSIHENSTRKKMPFVIINCATLPENLIESILFGHEKGAFTGAVEKRIGKFEQAQGGTIFLDEIGEMPLSMQVKLLRVLQEREIERIGGLHAIPIDVRILAATNRNLEAEVEAGKFRLDLYYRLYVYPIVLPSLKSRKEDIPLLVTHFIEKYNRSKEPLKISDAILNRIINFDWTGNVRQLEHYIERSVLLAGGNLIDEAHYPLTKTSVASDEAIETGSFNANGFKSLVDQERDYILSILRKCNGKVFGAGGAAEILKIPTSTLNSKIKKLGITKGDIHTFKE